MIIVSTQAVPIERIETFARDGYWYVKALQFVKDLHPLYENKKGELDGDYTRDFAIARDAGFRWVLVSYRSGSEYLPQRLTKELTRVCGEPVIESRGLAVWAIPEVEVDSALVAEWQAEHLESVGLLDRGNAPGAPGPQLQ